jgi:hypothetical protein
MVLTQKAKRINPNVATPITKKEHHNNLQIE